MVAVPRHCFFNDFFSIPVVKLNGTGLTLFVAVSCKYNISVYVFDNTGISVSTDSTEWKTSELSTLTGKSVAVAVNTVLLIEI